MSYVTPAPRCARCGCELALIEGDLPVARPGGLLCSDCMCDCGMPVDGDDGRCEQCRAIDDLGARYERDMAAARARYPGACQKCLGIGQVYGGYEYGQPVADACDCLDAGRCPRCAAGLTGPEDHSRCERCGWDERTDHEPVLPQDPFG